MKLSDNIFSMVSVICDDNVIHAEITLNAGSDIYIGHFPGNPITPGVVISGMAREILQYVYSRKLFLLRADSIKYSAILSPVEHPKVDYYITVIELSERCLKCKVIVSDASVKFATMSLTFVNSIEVTQS